VEGTSLIDREHESLSKEREEKANRQLALDEYLSSFQN